MILVSKRFSASGRVEIESEHHLLPKCPVYQRFKSLSINRKKNRMLHWGIGEEIMGGGPSDVLVRTMGDGVK